MLQSYLFGVINKWTKYRTSFIECNDVETSKRLRISLPKPILSLKRNLCSHNFFLLFTSLFCLMTKQKNGIRIKWSKEIFIGIYTERKRRSAFLLTLCVWLVYLLKSIRVPECQLSWNGIAGNTWGTWPINSHTHIHTKKKKKIDTFLMINLVRLHWIHKVQNIFLCSRKQMVHVLKTGKHPSSNSVRICEWLCGFNLECTKFDTNDNGFG